MAGSTLPAQSSSEKNSIVAPNASKPALRACTNGSRRDLEKAAMRTLDRDYPLSAKEISRAPNRTYTLSKILCYFAQADSCIGTDSGLFIIRSPRQIFQ